MSLERAVRRAYKVMAERNWDSIYWAIDLHGTVIESNYETGTYSYISEEVKRALQEISNLKESQIILWSSMHFDDQVGVTTMFLNDGIQVHNFNQNPREQNTATGCFDQKFYFSILVDDKAGFDPSEWESVRALTVQLSEEFHRGSAQ